MPASFATDTPKLGFGLMRLPKKLVLTDIEQFKEMVDLFLAAGFTYFDTAFVYGTSEQDTKKALVDRHPRDSYTLATKLNAMFAPSEKSAKDQFYTSLKRTGAGYFDFYLLHAIKDEEYTKYDKFHIWDFVAARKAEGLVKHMGFSFHGTPELLDQVLTDHPEVDFVQLQLNYLDWNDSSISSRENYEIARKHNKPIVVMEPVKGGKLANPPKAVKELFQRYNPNLSPASWAIRFAASLDGILTVLSGMSSIAQMEDNLSFMTNFQPLSEEEHALIREAQKRMGNSAEIPCTACHYCTDGCPKQIPIPDIFAAANLQLGNGQTAEARARYDAVLEGHKASDCIGCKQCERACPQHISVVEKLQQCSAMLS